MLEYPYSFFKSALEGVKLYHFMQIQTIVAALGVVIGGEDVLKKIEEYLG